MTAAETELVAAPRVVRHLPADPRPPKRNRRLGTVAASLVIVGGSAGMAAAASGALPGEPLYPIKRGVEQVATAVRLGDASKGKALLDQAATRLDEVRAAPGAGLSRPRPGREPPSKPSGAPPTRARPSCSRPTRPSGDTEDITTVRDFTAEQMADIARPVRHLGQHRRAAARCRRHPGRHRPAGARPLRGLRPARVTRRRRQR